MVSLFPYPTPFRIGAARSNAAFNRLTLGVYEMGSTMKTLNTAMAQDYGVAKMSSSYDARFTIHIGRCTIHDDHPKARWLSVPKIYMYSSNIGSAKMAVDEIGRAHV